MALSFNDLGLTIEVTGDAGLAKCYLAPGFNLVDGNETLLDCSGATFTVQQDSSLPGGANRYPLEVRYMQNDYTLRGGEIWGTVSLTQEWNSLYKASVSPGTGGNSAAVLCRSYDGHTIVEDWRIDRAWDAIRINVAYSIDAPAYFTVRNSHCSNIRDECIEVDQGQSGLVQNCLFDNTFVGISSTPSEASWPTADQNIIDFDGSLVKLALYNYEGTPRLNSPFKWYATNSPQLRFKNTIIAVPEISGSAVDWNYYVNAFNRTHVGSENNNYWLNLSDTPRASGHSVYDNLPACFTYMEGQTARDFWATQRQAWIDGVYNPTPPPAVAPPELIHTIKLTSARDTIRFLTDEAFSVAQPFKLTADGGSDTDTVTITVS